MNYYVDNSKIHGKGIFANKNFVSGEKIGHLISVVDHKEPGKSYFESPLSKSLHTIIERSELERYLNHNSNNNAKCQANGSEVELIASKDIKRGEEITTDYIDAFKELDKAQIIYRRIHPTNT